MAAQSPRNYWARNSWDAIYSFAFFLESMAYSPSDSEHNKDQWPLTGAVAVGRKPPADLPIKGEWLSKTHFRISPEAGQRFPADCMPLNEKANGIQSRPQYRVLEHLVE
jgi:hypothetical protein